MNPGEQPASELPAEPEAWDAVPHGNCWGCLNPRTGNPWPSDDKEQRTHMQGTYQHPRSPPEQAVAE